MIEGSSAAREPERSDRELSEANLPRAQSILRQEIEYGGGSIVERDFVSRPGCSIVSSSALSDVGRELFGQINIDQNAPEASQLAEALSRQTYLSFRPEPSDSTPYLNRVVDQAGHRSITKGTSHTILISGISLQAAIELVALGGDIARLTSSKTKAMNETFYRLPCVSTQGQELFMDAVREFVLLRNELIDKYDPAVRSSEGVERFNMFNLVSKTVGLFHTMNLKGHHTLFNRVLGTDESGIELRQIVQDLATQLHQLHPAIIKSAEEYGNVPVFGVHSSRTDTGKLKQIDTTGCLVEGGWVLRPGVIPFSQISALEDLERSSDFAAEELSVRFDINGIAFETAMEFAAHSEASLRGISELHSPSLQSDERRYRVQSGENIEPWEEEALCAYEKLRNRLREQVQVLGDSYEREEVLNLFELGTRAVSIQFSMNLADFHKLFIGRLSHHGNELEVQEVCRLMCAELHRRFPEFILHPDKYYQIGNEAKYST